MFDSLFTWLLLPLGMVLGWVLARKSPPDASASGEGNTTEQLGGLITQLSGDDPDQALAALTQAAEMDHSMAELHLTLGNLFRKRGEVDRALRIHEALAARPGLKPALLEQVRFELAQDYVKAGVMDRAEALLQELAAQGTHVAAALELLRTTYEQGREWRQAIDATRRLESVKGETRRKLIAHYWCELAEEARAVQQPAEALKLALSALTEDKTGVRANLLLGSLYETGGNFPEAIKAYRRALDQDGRFLAAVLEPLRRCYEALADKQSYLDFLADAKEQSHSSLPWLSEVQLLRSEGKDVMPQLAESLEQRPSRAVLAQFLEELEKRPEFESAGLSKTAASLRQAIKRLMEATPGYLCSHCGFAPRQQFWQCPSCKQWGSTTPTDDVLKPAA